MRAFSSCWISTRFLNLFGTCLDVTLDHSDDFSITGRTRSCATSTSHEISVRRDRTDESTDELRQGVWNKCSCNAGGSSHYRFAYCSGNLKLYQSAADEFDSKGYEMNAIEAAVPQKH